MKWSAIIVAAGNSSRANLSKPKQYTKLKFENHYEPVLTQSARQILPFVECLRIVIHKDHAKFYDEAMQEFRGNEKILNPIFGGSTRQESVKLGLESLPRCEYVMIHDAARPYVTPEIIKNIKKSTEENGTAVPTISVNDAACLTSHNQVKQYLNRSDLALVQTPQAFRLEHILKTHKESTNQNFDDDASMAVASGTKIATIQGDSSNKKLTQPEDFTNNYEFRTTTAFDMHAFCDGDSLKLCGVSIPYHKSLLGHSDADVALHALCDAMLAAAEQDDIGQQFPPTDDKWKNADSAQFINFANKKLNEKNMKLSFVDITIICEEPKIAPHRLSMKQNMSMLLSLSQNRIAVKASTTEKLGSLGRKEGIAAIVTINVKIPT